jgi:hypothetical protein
VLAALNSLMFGMHDDVWRVTLFTMGMPLAFSVEAAAHFATLRQEIYQEHGSSRMMFVNFLHCRDECIQDGDPSCVHHVAPFVLSYEEAESSFRSCSATDYASALCCVINDKIVDCALMDSIKYSYFRYEGAHQTRGVRMVTL